MFDYFFFLYIFIIILFEVTAQYLYKLSYLKKYESTKNIFVIIGVIFYSISGFLAYKILKYGDLGIVNVIWHLFHFFVLFYVGYYLLKKN